MGAKEIKVYTVANQIHDFHINPFFSLDRVK